MYTSIRRLLVPTLALFVAACDDGGLAPAAPFASAAALSAVASSEDDAREHPNFHRVEEGEQYFNRLVTFGCGPLDEGSTELVSVDGVARRKSIEITLPDGTMRYQVHVQPTMLQGVGLRTGDAYVVSTQGGDWDVYADDFARGSRREVWSMRNLVTGEKYSLTYVVRWEMDADRNLVEHREEERVRCAE